MMDPITALHNAARTYCIERVKYWHEQYAKLHAEGRDYIIRRSDCRSYSDEAYNQFPRYNILNAILREVDSFIPANFASIENVRQLLSIAGETASSPFTQSTNPTETAAIAEERQLFQQYIQQVNVEECAKLPLLPFCRILGQKEHHDLMKAFEHKWGKWYGGCCDTVGSSTPCVTIHTQAMESPQSYQRLHEAIACQGITRLLELREYGDGFELDLQSADFCYNGAEGFWTVPAMSWMIYASHESSITFGGTWLIETARAIIPEFQRYIYRGWDLKEYESDKLS